ncbi:MAG: pentapeptide repeat-containing protein [Lachnospiraceae bacterium]|nr:pentapeptide repeat-containing protein [Lachnospiraceae bacterium]
MAVDKLDNRNRLLQQMGLIYNQIMDLNEQMTDALQKAVDIDISVTGGVSDITKEFMEGFHYKIDERDRVVSEQNKWEYDQLPPVKETTQQEQDTAIPKRNIAQEELNKLLGEHRERHDAGNYEPLDLSNCVFDKIEFTGNLSDINLMNSEFNECIFRNADVENSYLSNAEFMNTAFSDCTFDNSNFYGAEMGYCAMEYTIYTDCDFSKAAMVACDISSSGMNDCHMKDAVVSDTKFEDTIINHCHGIESIDFSGVNKDLRNSAEKIFNNPEHTFDFEIISDDEMAISARFGEESVTEIYKVDYNADTHKIDNVIDTHNLSPMSTEWALINRAVDLIRMDILKGFHKRQIDNKEISRFSPCVMVETSDALGIKWNTLYDLKEFSDRLESYGRVSNISGYDNVNFTVMFDPGDGSIRKCHDGYNIRSDKESLIERLESSKLFNNAEINYLKNYISGEMSPVIDTAKTQDQAAAPAEPEAPQKEESSRKENKQTATPAKYVALVYVKGSDARTRVTGTSPEKIIELCREWNADRASDNQLETAYIKKYNPGTKAYENFGKYDVSTGVDLQPIYLDLPPLGKEKFVQVTAELKANGAKYNSEMKKWYVTQANDLSLFKDYLSKQSEPQIGTKGEDGKKKSVIGNLNQNKSHLNEKGNKGTQAHEQQRKHEEPAR